MPRPLIEITVDSIDPEKALQAARDFVSAGSIGRVYSEGAEGPSGRYDHWVQSAVSQAYMHVGRWQTNEDAVEEFESEATAVAEKAAEAIFETGDKGSARPMVVELLEAIKKWMQDYPPAPAGSRYGRTNTLYKSWRAQPII